MSPVPSRARQAAASEPGAFLLRKPLSCPVCYARSSRRGRRPPSRRSRGGARPLRAADCARRRRVRFSPAPSPPSVCAPRFGSALSAAASSRTTTLPTGAVGFAYGSQLSPARGP
eukprot:3682478-Prymnesium_polylepis.1